MKGIGEDGSIKRMKFDYNNINKIIKIFIKSPMTYENILNYIRDIQNIITKLKDPHGRNLSDLKVIEELQEIFSFSKEVANKYKNDWDTYYKLKQEQGKNIFISRKIELGAIITLQQLGSDLSVNLSNITSYKQFEKIILILEVLVYQYKNTGIDYYTSKKKKKEIFQNVVFSSHNEFIFSETESSDDDDEEDESDDSFSVPSSGFFGAGVVLSS